MTALTAKPLTQAAFTPFGQVLSASSDAPERVAYAGQVENTRPNAKANLTFIRSAPKPPIIRVLEHHPFSNQFFIPMKDALYLVAVCPPLSDGAPDVERLVAFIAKSGQAVNYNLGVWHAPLCALENPVDFVMQRWDDGGPEDTVAISLETPIAVTYTL